MGHASPATIGKVALNMAKDLFSLAGCVALADSTGGVQAVKVPRT